MEQSGWSCSWSDAYVVLSRFSYGMQGPEAVGYGARGTSIQHGACGVGVGWSREAIVV